MDHTQCFGSNAGCSNGKKMKVKPLNLPAVFEKKTKHRSSVNGGTSW